MKGIYLTLFLWSIVLAGAAQNVEAGYPRRNVLFVIADDLSNVLFSSDSAAVIAPNIKALAANGRLFERAYCQSSLCNPSRASLLTGRRPSQLGIWNNDPHFRGMNPRIITLPQYFKQNGYHSVGIGKLYHNWGHVLEGDALSWSEPQRFHWGVHSADWYIRGRPYHLHMDIKKGAAVQCVDIPDEAYLDGRIADAAVNKLRMLRETPFFMAVGFWKPHLPYNAPKKYWDLYDREQLPLVRYASPVAGVPDIAYVDSDEARSYSDIPPHGTPIPEGKQLELRHGYLAAISYLDAQVGKVLRALEELGLARNTIVVFTSDHGYHAGEHGQFGKWTNFEQGTQVPLIISTPDMEQRGAHTNAMVELVDLYPTLVDLCNLPVSRTTEMLAGLSLSPVIYNPSASLKSTAVTQIARPLGGQDNLAIVGSSIRDSTHRYNRWVDLNSGEVVCEELYDLSDDIYEINNIVDDSSHNFHLERLRKNLATIIPFSQMGNNTED